MELVVNGMKLSPINPNFLQSRNSILAATQATNPEFVNEIWNGFATRERPLVYSQSNKYCKY
jgi:hypothetical protein